ncbi:MAG: hypothetical protein JST84_09200 [Acidobacteria bacterium]|nr:hypothetical protein [Acidobacteriota bacterium]
MKKIITTITTIALAFALSTVAFGQKTARQRKAARAGNAEVQPNAKGQRLAVLPFQHKADNQWWYHGGAEAAQDVFVTELVRSGKFSGVVEREQLAAQLKQNNLTLSGDVDPSTAVKVGKLLGVNYLLTGSVTEYGNTSVGGGGFGKARKAKPGMRVTTNLIDTSTGEIVWADEVRSSNVSVFGVGGGVDDNRRSSKLMQDCARQVGQKFAAAPELSQLVKTPRRK